MNRTDPPAVASTFNSGNGVSARAVASRNRLANTSAQAARVRCARLNPMFRMVGIQTLYRKRYTRAHEIPDPSRRGVDGVPFRPGSHCSGRCGGYDRWQAVHHVPLRLECLETLLVAAA